jgi:hypothetical protein
MKVPRKSVEQVLMNSTPKLRGAAQHAGSRKERSYSI